MDITFNVPHLFHSASTPNGNNDALRILHDCLVRLNHAYSHNGVGPARYRIDGRCVEWNLPHVFHPDCSNKENAYALRCLLDCLIELNTSYLNHSTKQIIPTLYTSGVRYGRTQIWDTIPALYRRRYGDCKSLTAALISQYIHQGKECAPVFRFNPRNNGSGAMDFHILVQTASTILPFEDPSKILGMGVNEVAPIRGLEEERF